MSRHFTTAGFGLIHGFTCSACNKQADSSDKKKQPIIIRLRLSDLSEKITFYFVNVILIVLALVRPKNNAKAPESVFELGLNVNVLFVPSSTLKLPE